MKNKRNKIILIITIILLVVFVCNLTTPNMRLRKSLKNISETKSIIIYKYTGEKTSEDILEFNGNLYSKLKVIKYTDTLNKMISIFSKIEINLEEVAVVTDENVDNPLYAGNPLYIFDLIDENGNKIMQIRYLNLSIEGLNDNLKLADEYKNELNEIIDYNEQANSKR